MIFDWHDECPEWSALPWLHKLKEMRPDFVCTLFAIPGRAPAEHWATYPPWIELCPHGWQHESPHETEHWGAARMRTLLDEPVVKEHFSRGWCSPGWLVSDGTYQVLKERDYWISDHPKNDHRRPKGLMVHRLGDGDHWHGHTHNVCGNGIEETFAEVEGLVRAATGFQFMSDAVC